MLTLQEMLNAAAYRWQGLAARASAVTVSGINSGFRPGWQVPDPSYPGGVQEVIFVTHSGNDKMGMNYLKDGTSYAKPYRTIFRFPLDPATGQPFPESAKLNIPTYVHCSCPAFRFYCEKEATTSKSSDIINSNGAGYRTNEPTYICKHLVATATKAIALRRKIGTGVTSSSAKPDPKAVSPKRRDPNSARRAANSNSVNPPTRKVSATSSSGIPQTWLGRLLYVLFNERSGR